MSTVYLKSVYHLLFHSEVFDALLKLRNNYTRWKDLLENSNDIAREDFTASVMELRNGIKSIQWDLDELEESLGRLSFPDISYSVRFILSLLYF